MSEERRAGGRGMTEPDPAQSADNAATSPAIGDYSAAQIVAAISAALRANDMKAAAALMPVLAVKDPASAQLILDAVEFLS